MTENRRIFWNVIATYGRSLYGLVLGLLCGRWALMALGEVDYGLMGLVGGLTVFIAFFNNVLAGANARFYAFSVGAANAAEDKNAALEECRRWFNTALSIHTIVPIVLIVVGYPLGVYAIAHWLTIPSERIHACVWVFRFVCLSCFVGMMNVPFTAMYNAKQYIAELTIYSFVTSTLNVCLLGYMVSHPSVWLARYAAWTCCLSVIPQLIICYRAVKIFPECHLNFGYMWDRERLKKIGAYSSWQLLGCLCGMLRINGIAIVINKFFGAAMNAAQSIGNTVQGQCNTLAGAMQSAFTPVITQACGAKDYEKMKKFALRTCKFNVMLYAIFAIPLVLELPVVLKLWLKNTPAFTTGLCFCAMMYYLVGCCTVGHMIVVNATGRIAAYHVVLSCVNIFTIPLAVVAGFIWHNVYAVMGGVIFMEVLNSIGRVLFARHLTGMSIRQWALRVMAPLTAVSGICLTVGFLPRFFMNPGLVRVGVTTLFCEVIYIPMIWFVILSNEEQEFVIKKIGPKFRRLFGRR